MRLLIDTNIILEVMLSHPQARAAQAFLALAGKHEFHLSIFALHSIYQILLRRKLAAPLDSFLKTAILSGNIIVLSLPSIQVHEVVDTARLLGLDFDDAYQYTVAENTISFDKDFDKTPRGRQTPQAINQLTSSNP
jgi:predicted nucleic acid-binding protein